MRGRPGGQRERTSPRRRSRSRSRSGRDRRRSASRPRRRRARPSAIPTTWSARRRRPASPSPSRRPPSSAGICTVSGSTVSFVAAGTCTINADQPGNATLRGRAAGAAVVHDRRPVGPERPVDQLHVVGSVRRRRRRARLHGLGLGELRPARQLLDRPGERGSLHAVGRQRCPSSAPARARSAPTRPGTRATRPRRQVIAVVRREPRGSDDQLHVGAAGRRGHRRAGVHRDCRRRARASPSRSLPGAPRSAACPARRSRSSRRGRARCSRTRRATAPTQPRRRSRSRSPSPRGRRRSASRRRLRAGRTSAARPTPSPRPPAPVSPSPSRPAVPRSAASPGSTVSFTRTGTCIVRANQPGNGELRGGAAGAAVVHRRPGAVGPDDHVHLERAVVRRVPRAELQRLGNRELRPPGHLHGVRHCTLSGSTVAMAAPGRARSTRTRAAAAPT